MTNPNPPDRRELRYLDDLHVGDRFTSGTHQIDQQQITAFARQFDPQPFHLDALAAKDSLFGGLVASGWHTAAISMRLMVDSGPAIAGGLIGVGAEIRWPNPTRPGDVLHVEGEILELRTSQTRPAIGIVALRSTTLNQHGDILQIFVAKLRVPRRNSAVNSA
jgi:acyl dehydratase